MIGNGLMKLLGQGQGLEGLLGNPMFMAGLGMLGSSGYSDTPQTFGEVLGAGFGGMQQAQGFRDQREDRKQRQEDREAQQQSRQTRDDYYRAQIDNINRPKAAPSPRLPAGYKWNSETQTAEQIQGLPESMFQPKAPEREMFKSADGRQYWKDTLQPVLENEKLPEKKREVRNDPNGIPRYMDTGEVVFDGVEKKNTLSGETAGRYAAVKQALEEDMPRIEAMAFDEGEVADRHLWPNLPWATKSKQLDGAIRRALNAVLRMESGAVVSQSEVDEAMQVYRPSHFDSTEGAKQKLQALRTRMENAMTAIDGTAIDDDYSKYSTEELYRMVNSQ